MQLIGCPNCGPREETEFHYGGAAGIAYPDNPAALDDVDWAHYLFFRPNPMGRFTERWYHSSGCRRWFTAERDTVTYAFTPASPETPTSPEIPASPEITEGAR